MSKVRYVVTGFIAVVLVYIIGVGVTGDPSLGIIKPKPVPSGAIPSFVDPSTLAWSPNADSTAKSTLVIWEDFQCPYCKSFETALAPTVKQMAAANLVKVEYRPTSFLDERWPGRNSARAVNAWACAIEAGIGQEYHSTVFANQPATEGDGYTDAQLKSFADTAGITADKKPAFETCVNNGTYNAWSTQSTALFHSLQIAGTPNIQLDGVEPAAADISSVSAFAKWVTDHAKK